MTNIAVESVAIYCIALNYGIVFLPKLNSLQPVLSVFVFKKSIDIVFCFT